MRQIFFFYNKDTYINAKDIVILGIVFIFIQVLISVAFFYYDAMNNSFFYRMYEGEYEDLMMFLLQNTSASALMIILSLSTFLVFLVLYRSYRLRNKAKQNVVFYLLKQKIKNPHYILYGFLLSISVSVVIGPIITLFPASMEAYNNAWSNSVSVPLILTITLFVPIIEEVIFRGILLRDLNQNNSLFFSVLLSSVLFSIAHGNMIQGIATFLGGFILAFVYIKTYSIWGAILVHCFNNATSCVIDFYTINIGEWSYTAIVLLCLLFLLYTFLRYTSRLKRMISSPMVHWIN